MTSAIHRRSVQMLVLLAIVVTALLAPHTYVQQAEVVGYYASVSSPFGAAIIPGLGHPSTWVPIKIRLYPSTSNIWIKATWGPTYPSFLPIQEAILIYNYDSMQVMFWELS
jgi:hypothetical protein